MLATNLVPFAENVGLSVVIATASATLLPIADGTGRLSVGGISDRIGRERSMAVAFSLCGVGLFELAGAGAVDTTIGFLSAVALAAFFEGTHYSLFPSVVGDYYGQNTLRRTTRYSIRRKWLAESLGGVVVGWLVATTSWSIAFLIGGALALAAGLGTLVLRPPDEAAQAS